MGCRPVGLLNSYLSERHPKLATVKVGGDRDNPLMVRDGVTSAELRAELIAMMMEAQETGEVLQLPAPIDGVANRDANRG